MASKSEEKRELILTKAEQVFIRRGFNGVTMKDIIAECEISRGGIYLYFSSVDEIFVEVITRHNKIKFDQIKIDVSYITDFEYMLDSYFDMQKERLLHMENSLLLAVFEFFIAHKHEADKDFYSGTFSMLNNAIIEILNCGVKAGCLDNNIVHILADNILFFIKGIETLAMSSGVSKDLLDTQFDFCKKIIFSQREGLTNDK